MLAFVGMTSYNSSIKLATLQGSIMSRAEVEAKIAEVNAKQLALEKDLTALKLALAERGIKERQQ